VACARRGCRQDGIARNLARPDLSVAELAARHGCAPRFIRVFRRHYGAAPSDVRSIVPRDLPDIFRSGERGTLQ
jgi:hypothetical protein